MPSSFPIPVLSYEECSSFLISHDTPYTLIREKFVSLPEETPERMFARFNVLAKPLEDEQPRIMTREQLKTTYHVHLRTLLSPAEIEDLDRDVRDSERDRARRGYDPLSRHDIHDMVLSVGIRYSFGSFVI